MPYVLTVVCIVTPIDVISTHIASKPIAPGGRTQTGRPSNAIVVAASAIPLQSMNVQTDRAASRLVSSFLWELVRCFGDLGVSRRRSVLLRNR